MNALTKKHKLIAILFNINDENQFVLTERFICMFFQVKCHQYWPIGDQYGGEDDLLLSDVNLKITFNCQKEDSHYILREFKITDLEVFIK